MQQDTMYFTAVPSSFPQGTAHASFLPTTTAWPPNSLMPSVTSTPVSTAMYGTTATFSWAHTVPTFMPWASKTDGSSAEPVIRFTAPFPPDPCTSQTATSWELLHNLGANKTNANQHLKRKSFGAETEIGPQKQYISEERMTARMKQLHISNQYSLPQENSPFEPYGDSPETIKAPKPIRSLEELEAMLADESDNSDSENCRTYKGSLVLAPEIKKLVEPEKLFAKTLINEIERPKMAVVLWQPPHGTVRNAINSSLNSPTEEQVTVSSSSISSSVPLSSSLHEANNNSVSVGIINNNQDTSVGPSIGHSTSPLITGCVPSEASASLLFDADDDMDV